MKFVKVNDYEIMDAPVTQNEWKELMGNNPSYFKGNNNPVESVSWNDCQEYIKKLNNKKDGYIYRFPTEAEWEYCAKSCDDIPIDKQAWHYGNSNNKTHPIKKKIPNKLGLYDMLGNVWEWCQDLWDTSGSVRVVRGGGWYDDPQVLRAAGRYYNDPGYRLSNVGFRLVRTLLPFNTIQNKTEHALSIAKKALQEIEEILNTKKNI